MHPMLGVAIGGAIATLLAWGLFALVRRWDRTNAVLAGAPALPIKLVNVWDAVWIRGDIECDHPLIVPYFGHHCVHFTYQLEEKVQKTRRKSDGKTETYYEWETRDRQAGQTSFRVRDDGEALTIDVARAQWHYEPSASDTVGKWRHSCTYLPYPGVVSAVGVVGEQKTTMEPLRHVPLIVTPRSRRQYLESAERAERWAAGFGHVFVVAGMLGLGYGLTRYAQTPAGLPGEDWWHPVAGLIAIPFGMAATLLLMALRAYNSFVILHTRAELAWSGINILLKQRYDVIPRLVEVVKGYVQHESTLLEDLAALRSRALSGDRAARVGSEGAALDSVTRLVMLAESYPELKANDQFRNLSEEMIALEEKIAHARTFYNESVKEYNTHRAVFPPNLVASCCGFKPFPLFAAELEERHMPRLEFNRSNPVRP